jgi:hypothetical protein
MVSPYSAASVDRPQCSSSSVFKRESRRTVSKTEQIYYRTFGYYKNGDGKQKADAFTVAKAMMNNICTSKLYFGTEKKTIAQICSMYHTGSETPITKSVTDRTNGKTITPEDTWCYIDGMVGYLNRYLPESQGKGKITADTVLKRTKTNMCLVLEYIVIRESGDKTIHTWSGDVWDNLYTGKQSL